MDVLPAAMAALIPAQSGGNRTLRVSKPNSFTPQHLPPGLINNLLKYGIFLGIRQGANPPFTTMIKNYLKTAFRILKKHKGFTAINVLGLSIGLATCLSIILYIVDELSYDRYNVKSERIVRANLNVKFGGKDVSYAGVQAPLAGTVKKDFPEVENTVRLAPCATWRPEGFPVKKGDETIQENNIAFADPGLFDVFTLPMIDGNPATALTQPNTVVITESTARKYFGRPNAVGQTLLFNDSSSYRVTGVIKDIPKQSHFSYDFFLSMSSMPESRETGWLGGGFNSYLLLKPGADYKKLQAKISEMMRNNVGGSFGGIAAFEKNGNRITLDLSPLTSIHLYSNRAQELGRNNSSQYIFIFSAISLLILLIACVNFMNLSTARSANRAREVGVRKVLGSGRGSLIAQFLTESVLVTFISTVIALALTYFLLPLFNQLSGKELSFTIQTFTWLLPSALVLILIVGFVTGSYPAFVLSAFQPIEVLKGKLSQRAKGGGFRSFLVVFQFSISIFLIIGTLVIFRQLTYIRNKNLGYDRNQVMVIHNVTPLGDKAKVLKQVVRQLNGVVDATLSNYLPTGEKRNATSLVPIPNFDENKAVLTEFWPVDEDYATTLGLQFAAGRNFSHRMLTDSSAIIINEAAARLFGFTDPLNKVLYQFTAVRHQYHIIGVIRDFNFNSLRENVTPLVLSFNQSYGALSARVSTANLPLLLSQVKSAWKSVAPGQEFDYSFMDADFDAAYRSEQRIGTVFFVFTALAIAIACLGIFGLAAFSAERRSKEIGIRKVLGASVPSIIGMLSKDFVKLVCIAILIASPVAWIVMQKWLQGFAYRAGIQWWIIAIGGLTAILIALLTVSFQAVKAAVANPVKSLKTE
jgi:putative ABC transport system permease protein